jgi:type III secretion system FlhB-like substrate exporter
VEKSRLTWAQQILATAEKVEAPLHEQRGLLENISRMQHGLTPDELWRYVQMSRAVRARLTRALKTS